MNFNYAELCRMQEIQVQAPQGLVVDESKVDSLIDLILRACRIKNKVAQLKIESLNELKFAKQNNMTIHGVTYTSTVADMSNRIYRESSGAGGLTEMTDKTLGTPDCAPLRSSLQTCLNMMYTESYRIVTGMINKKAYYEKYGSSSGYSPLLNVEDATDICKRCIHLENIIYDYIYIAGTIAFSSLSQIYGQQAPAYLTAKLKSYELFEGEGDAAMKTTLRSFKPESRFDIEDFELISTAQIGGMN